jgi:hypothetical protein
MIGDFAGQYPDLPSWSVAHAALLARVGRLQEAHEVLARRPPDPDELIRNVFPFWAAFLAWIPFYLDDARLAARVAATLRPYRGYWGHMYTFVVGPVTFHLALCAAATGDLDESVALFEESDQVLAGFGCHGLLPVFRLTYVEVLRRRGSDNDLRRAMQLLDQIRQGATAIGAPNLVRQADELAAVVSAR